MKLHRRLIAGLTILSLNASALAAPLATYSSPESFATELQQSLEERKKEGFHGGAPRAIAVHDAKKFIQSNLNATVAIHVLQTAKPAPWPTPLDKIERFTEDMEDIPTFLPSTETQGSGAVVTQDGYIVTNYHVVQNAAKLGVVMNDGKEFIAKLIGVDPEVDLAVIKIEGANFPTIRWGDARRIEVGAEVVAIGSPFGLKQTVTTGIVSQTHRQDLNMNIFEDYIQISAAVNKGSSGGPLFLAETGEFIGINSSIWSNTEGFVGIAMAIPVDLVADIAGDLIKYGRISRTRMGISLVKLDNKARAYVGAPPDLQGVLIGTVLPDGPNAKTGLQAMDVVVELAGIPVSNSYQLRRISSKLPANSTAKIVVWREKKLVVLSAAIAPGK